MREKPRYYRLELDDYSAAAFTSFGKYYYGTTEDFRCFFRELTIDMALKKQFGDLISRFQSFEEGQQNISHYIAYRKIPFLVPAHLLHKETVILENYEWEHTNTWGLPYYMRCDKVESEHLWFACDGEYCRTVKAVFSKLQYAGDVGQWKHVGTMLWGFPCILAGNQFGFRNRLSNLRPWRKSSRIGRCFSKAQILTIRSFAMTSLVMADTIGGFHEREISNQISRKQPDKVSSRTRIDEHWQVFLRLCLPLF